MNKLYTWQDVERDIISDYRNWPLSWLRVEVYPGNIVITYRKNKEVQWNEVDKYFNNRYKKKYRKEKYKKHLTLINHKLKLDFGSCDMDIAVDQSEEEDSDIYRLPLFSEYDRDYNLMPPLQGPPVIAFHSTENAARYLILLALGKELNTIQKKVLVVDSNLEVPMLTHLINQGKTPEISLIDCIEILHNAEYMDQAPMEFIAKKMQPIPSFSGSGTNLFLPAYRYGRQLTNCTTPKILVSMKDRQWILGDFFSEIGKMLGVDMVLVDLPVGYNEISAPLLFDRRIEKIIVSPSIQSILGVEHLLPCGHHVSVFCPIGSGRDNAIEFPYPKKFFFDNLSEALNNTDGMSEAIREYLSRKIA